MKRRIGLFTAFIVTILFSLAVLEVQPTNLNSCYARSITAHDISISWGNRTALVFNGTADETQSGDVTFIVNVNADSSCKKVQAKIIGTAFSNGTNSLDTEYRLECETSWHKSGDPIIVDVAIGKTYRIFFRATTGHEVTSQQAGAYQSKITVRIIPIH